MPGASASAAKIPGFANGVVTDPLAYLRARVGTGQASQWQSILAGLDPELTRLGFTREGTSSAYTFNGQKFDLLGQGGTAWTWQGQGDRTILGGSGSIWTAARNAYSQYVNRTPDQPPPGYTDPVSPASKYLEAIQAAQRQRRKGASGGRASTIVGGFSGGAPTTARATLMGSGY